MTRTYQFISPFYLLLDVLNRKASDVVVVGGRGDQGGGEKLQRTSQLLVLQLMND